jgi:hypothetical protein
LKDLIDPHRPDDVLEVLLAQILKTAIQPALYLVVDDRGDANATRLSDRF